MTFNPYPFESTGPISVSVTENAAGALSKLQADSQPPTTTLVAQAEEQANSTTLVKEAEEQSESTTTLVAQAGEQASTTLVKQAEEQNKDDIVIRNVESMLGDNFRSFDNADGIHKFFHDDVEENLIDNVSQVLARANFMSDIKSGRFPARELYGTVGEALIPSPKQFWHSSNEKVDVTKFVGSNFKAFNHDPKGVSVAVKVMEGQINYNMQQANLGKPLDEPHRENMRQFAENAVLLKLAMAEAKYASDPTAAKELINGKSGSVNRLIGIASEYGANKENIAQYKKMAEEIAGR